MNTFNVIDFFNQSNTYVKLLAILLALLILVPVFIFVIKNENEYLSVESRFEAEDEKEN